MKALRVLGEQLAEEEKEKEPRETVSDFLGAWLGWFLSLAGLFLLWEGAVRFRWLNPLLVSQPSSIARELLSMFASGEIWPHLSATVFGLVAGIGLALLAIPAGIIIGWLPSGAKRLIERWIDLLNQIPYPALVIVFLMILGLGFWQKVVTVWWRSVFPMLYFAIGLTESFAAKGGENRHYVTAGLALGMRQLLVIRTVVVPLVLPELIRSIRLAVGGAIRAILVAEIVAGSTGLGFLVVNYQLGYRMARVFGVIALATILGIGLTTILHMLERRAAYWRHHSS